jgi:hypothetical protein
VFPEKIQCEAYGLLFDVSLTNFGAGYFSMMFEYGHTPAPSLALKNRQVAWTASSLVLFKNMLNAVNGSFALYRYDGLQFVISTNVRACQNVPAPRLYPIAAKVFRASESWKKEDFIISHLRWVGLNNKSFSK